MLYGFDPSYNHEDIGPTGEPTWLDLLILSNPQGVMKVLAGYGYVGFLAPENQEELTECCQEIIEKHGEQAVIDLLKEHPLYEAIAEVCMTESSIKVPFKNASGEQAVVEKTIRQVDYKKLAETALVIIGAFYVAGKVWDYIAKM